MSSMTRVTPWVPRSQQVRCPAAISRAFSLRSFLPGPPRPQGRLKSLHSVYRKMVRKDVPVAQVRRAGLRGPPELSGSATCKQDCLV